MGECFWDYLMWMRRKGSKIENRNLGYGIISVKVWARPAEAEATLQCCHTLKQGSWVVTLHMDQELGTSCFRKRIWPALGISIQQRQFPTQDKSCMLSVLNITCSLEIYAIQPLRRICVAQHSVSCSSMLPHSYNNC